MREVPEYYYAQSAVVPFREMDGVLEILMISSRKKKRWVIPKGVREPLLSACDSAAKEALEEAGIEGRVSATAMGTYQYRKWGGICTVEVFHMVVETVHQEWEEDYRDRQWVSLEEAVNRVDEDALKMMIRALPECL